ncbi:MAG: hypothetical protein AAFX44_03555 [Pseudomonadota bacterium]
MFSWISDSLWLAIPILWVLWGIVSHHLNRNDSTDIQVSSMLTVLSALLAALAILVPLATSLLVITDTVSWQDKLLLAALAMAVVGLFCVVHCMITLPRKGDTYKPKEFLRVPVIVNGTWFVLVVLATAVVFERGFARGQQGDLPVSDPASQRFSVLRDLPALGSHLDDVFATLGRPSNATPNAVVYRLAASYLVFCFDADRQSTRILEAKEISDDAITRYCAAD